LALSDVLAIAVTPDSQDLRVVQAELVGLDVPVPPEHRAQLDLLAPQAGMGLEDPSDHKDLLEVRDQRVGLAPRVELDLLES